MLRWPLWHHDHDHSTILSIDGERNYIYEQWLTQESIHDTTDRSKMSNLNNLKKNKKMILTNDTRALFLSIEMKEFPFDSGFSWNIFDRGARV